MNIAYYRNSTQSFSETLQQTRIALEKSGFVVVGATTLSNQHGELLSIVHPEIFEQIIKIDKNAIGLIPSLVTVLNDSNTVSVGVGLAELVGMVVRRPELSPLVATFDNLLREVVHTAAKVEALKPEKVILYSTQTCPYCVMEKKWLDEKEIDHEVVYVDQSREAAEEMVKKTGQMGVPVTEITYTDADSEFIIGFDKNRLSQSLGLH